MKHSLITLFAAMWAGGVYFLAGASTSPTFCVSGRGTDAHAGTLQFK